MAARLPPRRAQLRHEPEGPAPPPPGRAGEAGAGGLLLGAGPGRGGGAGRGGRGGGGTDGTAAALPRVAALPRLPAPSSGDRSAGALPVPGARPGAAQAGLGRPSAPGAAPGGQRPGGAGGGGVSPKRALGGLREPRGGRAGRERSNGASRGRELRCRGAPWGRGDEAAEGGWRNGSVSSSGSPSQPEKGRGDRPCCPLTAGSGDTGVCSPETCLPCGGVQGSVLRSSSAKARPPFSWTWPAQKVVCAEEGS